jgi:hypothetical protein
MTPRVFAQTARALPLALAAMTACGVDLDLGTNDAAPPYDAACAPGTYSGTYQCVTGSGTSLALSTTGPIAVRLVPSGAHTLALAPDASVSSTMSGTTGTSPLSGTLDCSTLKLTGTVGALAISSSAFSGTVGDKGIFSAVYDLDASPPALVDGVLDTGGSATSATCSWNANLQPAL